MVAGVEQMAERKFRRIRHAADNGRAAIEATRTLGEAPGTYVLIN